MEALLKAWANQQMGNGVRGVAAQEGAGEGGDTKAAGCAPLVEKRSMVGNSCAGFVGGQMGLGVIKNTFALRKIQIMKAEPTKSPT